MSVLRSALQLFGMSRRGISWRNTAVFLAPILAVMMQCSSHAQDCPTAGTPTIVEVAHQPNSTDVKVSWYWVGGGTFCIYPQDFYQVRWGKGEGPTDSQSPRIDTISSNASWTVSGIDPNSIYGFIVEACINRTLQPARCTSWSPMAFYKPSGPDTCRSGFVWRDAFSGDHVCVTPQTRTETAGDNAASPKRTQANGNCIQGFVWRQAKPSDHVCVTPQMRSQAASDNSNSYVHKLPPP